MWKDQLEAAVFVAKAYVRLRRLQKHDAEAALFEQQQKKKDEVRQKWKNRKEIIQKKYYGSVVGSIKSK